MDIKTSVLCDRNFILCFNSLMCFFGVIKVIGGTPLPLRNSIYRVQYVIEVSLKFIYYSAFVGVCRFTDHKLPVFTVYVILNFENSLD